MEYYIIFFFSALGVFNGILLSIYFALNAKKKKFSNYFLSLLLLTLSIRITKSIFYYFNPQLASIFIQIGLSACILIGPFLYLYLKKYTEQKKVNWIIHTIPYLIAMTIMGIIYASQGHKGGWSGWIVKGVYLQWLIYIVLSFQYVKPFFKKNLERKRLKNIEFWIVSIYGGVSIIWLAYNVASYTSYIIGAISFSFVLYLIILLITFRNSKQSTFFEEKEKYKHKLIDDELQLKIEAGISNMVEKEMYTDSNLTLQKLADEISVPKHILSQYLNEKLKKSFPTFIHELRILKAQELLQSESHYTIEGIGFECGFKSKSTFFTTFKKIVGMTPAQFRRQKSG